MKFKIHYEIGDYQDYHIVEGETIEEIREVANEIVRVKQPDNYWSEELEP